MLPHASDGPSFQLAMLSGKFQGTISPTTLWFEGHVDAARHLDRLAMVLVDRNGAKVEHLGHHAHLATRVGDRLADVACLEPGQLFSVSLDLHGRAPQQSQCLIARRPRAP